MQGSWDAIMLGGAPGFMVLAGDVPSPALPQLDPNTSSAVAAPEINAHTHT